MCSSTDVLARGDLRSGLVHAQEQSLDNRPSLHILSDAVLESTFSHLHKKDTWARIDCNTHMLHLSVRGQLILHAAIADSRA